MWIKTPNANPNLNTNGNDWGKLCDARNSFIANWFGYFVYESHIFSMQHCDYAKHTELISKYGGCPVHTYIEYTNTNVNIVTTLFPFAVEFILHFLASRSLRKLVQMGIDEYQTNGKWEPNGSEYSVRAKRARKWKAFCPILHYDVKQKIFTSLSIIQSFNQQTDV